MKTEAEIKKELEALRARQAESKGRTAIVVLGAKADALEWVLDIKSPFDD